MADAHKCCLTPKQCRREGPILEWDVPVRAHPQHALGQLSARQPAVPLRTCPPDSLSPPSHCRFYDEIRTPLLSDIRIAYPPRLVQQATRTFFPNYFNGSEIIIAGKLADGQLDRLRVEVTASNSKKFVVLKTDVPVEPQRAGSDGPGGARPEEAGEAGPNHLERLWSYLTVRELLSSWLQSGAGQEKERLRQKAQALAVNSRFLTPFTSMKLTKALPTKRLEGAFGVSAVTGPGTAVQSLPPGTRWSPRKGPRPSFPPPFQAKVILPPPVACSVLFCCNLHKRGARTQLLAFRVCGTVGWFRCTLWISVGHLEKAAAVSETLPAGRHRSSVPRG